MSAETDLIWPTTALTRGLLADPLDLDFLVLRDDFVGGTAASVGLVGELSWATVNIASAATFDYIDAPANHPGIVRVTTGALDNDGGAITLNYGAGGLFTEVGRLPPLNALTGWKVRFAARINATTSISVRWGLAVDTNAVQAANGIWWQYDTDAPDANFSAVCRAAGTETKTASGVAADTAWHVFEIYSDVAGTISFTIDGGTPITIATGNVPAIALSPFFNVVTRTTAAKSMDVDAWGLIMTVSR